MVSDEIFHFSVPLIEHRFAVMVIANLNSTLPYECIDMLIGDGTHSAQHPVSTQTWDGNNDGYSGKAEEHNSQGVLVPVECISHHLKKADGYYEARQ